MASADFEWAANNLGVETPEELQTQRVNVFFAPNISPETKVVNLRDGTVDRFFEGQDRPEEGYYAEFESLARYCSDHGSQLVETDGQVSTQAA